MSLPMIWPNSSSMASMICFVCSRWCVTWSILSSAPPPAALPQLPLAVGAENEPPASGVKPEYVAAGACGGAAAAAASAAAAGAARGGHGACAPSCQASDSAEGDGGQAAGAVAQASVEASPGTDGRASGHTTWSHNAQPPATAPPPLPRPPGLPPPRGAGSTGPPLRVGVYVPGAEDGAGPRPGQLLHSGSGSGSRRLPPGTDAVAPPREQPPCSGFSPKALRAARRACLRAAFRALSEAAAAAAAAAASGRQPADSHQSDDHAALVGS
eukprot:NODE_9063_length_1449_cov_7.803328.p1 GENE.NODE_9063_length_1449_cov_7.803328~~NODE_9063_length_1449_cov_7.803328.p1  ORF type:complete len:270 (+),score=46.92 NODE_9063_length_1449_cov_7.803328:322-1131(+)